ncbi:hypothetical protein BSKO_11114 [Bryopsis sp. KO-2023]|nr:hypothetical protein BSKO_11114 [Bryopsis sp. KO-2023]
MTESGRCERLAHVLPCLTFAPPTELQKGFARNTGQDRIPILLKRRSLDGCLCMSSDRTVQPKTVLRGHGSSVQSVAFHRSEALLASGDAQGNVKLWHLNSRRAEFSQQLLPQELGIQRVGFEGDTLLVQGRNGVLKTWSVGDRDPDVENPQVEICTEYYGFCSSHHLGGVVAMPGKETGSVEIWSLKDAKLVCSLTPNQEEHRTGMCMAIQILPGDVPDLPSSILVGYENGNIAGWDLNAPSKPICSRNLFPEPILAFDCAPDGKRAIVGGANKSLVSTSLNLQEGSIKIRKNMTVVNEGVGSMSIRSSDGKILATGGWDGKIRIWKWSACTPLAVLKYHRKEVASLDFDTKGESLLAAGSRDGTVSLWSIYPT